MEYLAPIRSFSQVRSRRGPDNWHFPIGEPLSLMALKLSQLKCTHKRKQGGAKYIYLNIYKVVRSFGAHCSHMGPHLETRVPMGTLVSFWYPIESH